MFKKIFIIIIPFLIILGCTESDSKKPKTDLLSSVATANFEMIKEHIEYGTDINSTFITKENWKGASSLHIASISPTNSEQLKIFTRVIELLLESGADIEIKATNKDEATPLAWAVYFGKLEIVQLLVKKGASVNTIDKNGNTPLDAALSSPFMGSEKNRSMIISFLKEKGAKTNEKQ